MEIGPVTRRQAATDVAFCLSLALAYLVLTGLHLPIRYVIATLALGLIAYVIVLWRRGQDTWADLGLTKKNLGAACLATLGFTGICAAGILVVGYARGVPLWRNEFLILFPLYPLYGLAQQLFTQGVFHRKLYVLTQSSTLSVVMTALTFGVIHYRNPLLAGLCTLGGFGWAVIYRRYHNLWPLGASHGVLGALTYALIFDKNPLSTL
jgi:hypothetical protein